MLGSGARFLHVLEALNNYPDEDLYVDYLNRNIKRLECLPSHCRYYLGRENQVKPAGFIFFPRVLLPLIDGVRGRLPNRRRIERVARKWSCLAPKYVRIIRPEGDEEGYR